MMERKFFVLLVKAFIVLVVAFIVVCLTVNSVLLIRKNQKLERQIQAGKFLIDQMAYSKQDHEEFFRFYIERITFKNPFVLLRNNDLETLSLIGLYYEFKGDHLWAHKDWFHSKEF